MLVKKFEAKTMKDALEMVKKQLGPDAVIMAVKDHRKRFGLGGEGSVEITAAVSETSIRKKEFAETKIRESEREKFRSTSVANQKQFIERAVKNQFQRTEKEAALAAAPIRAAIQRPREMTQTRYADIEDDVSVSPSKSSQSLGQFHSNYSAIPKPQVPAQAPTRSLQKNSLRVPATIESAEQRIKNAAKRARDLFESTQSQGPVKRIIAGAMTHEFLPDSSKETPRPNLVSQSRPENSRQTQSEFESLKGEILQLKKLVSDVHSSAQTLRTYPGSEFGLPFDLSRTFAKLRGEGLMEDIVVALLQKAAEEIPSLKLRKKPIVEGWIAVQLLNSIQVVPKGSDAKIQVFLGSKGSGKTSQLIKMAAHKLLQEKKKILILTADTFKIGASEQMKIYSQILNVPFQVIRQPSDWNVISKILDRIDHVYIDTPGINPKNASEIQFLSDILPPRELSCQRHFVSPVSLKDEMILDTLKRLEPLKIADLVFTSLDEANHYGTIYNVMERSGLPLHSFGTGPRVPEDFEIASKERLLDLILKFTQSQEKESAT